MGSSCPLIVGWESSISSVLNTVATISEPFLHMHHLEISLGLGQASKPLLCFLGAAPHTCSSDLCRFQRRVKGSISTVPCPQWLLPHSLASRTSSSLFFWSERWSSLRGKSSPPFSHSVENTRGCPQIQSSKRRRGTPPHSLDCRNFSSCGFRYLCSSKAESGLRLGLKKKKVISPTLSGLQGLFPRKWRFLLEFCSSDLFHSSQHGPSSVSVGR